MSRKVWGGLIVLIWVVFLGFQVRREYFQPELAQLAEAASLSLAPGVSFYTLRMNERAVGLATSRLDTLSDGGFLLEDFLSLELPALGQTGTAVARTRVNLTPSLQMEDFSFALDSEAGRFEASGEVAGDSLLRVAVDAGGETQNVEYRLDQAPIFAAVLPLRIALGGEGLEVGREMRVPVFDPSTLSTRNVEVRILAHDTLVVPDSAALDPSTGMWEPARYDSIPAWQIAEAYGGVSVESWIDQRGRIVRAASPLGFTMQKTEYELADQARLAARRGEAPGSIDDDVILSTAIQSNVDLSNAEEFDSLRFRLTGVDLSGFELDGGRQELRGDTLIIRREDWREIEAGYELPYPRMDLAEFLRPEPLIQSDDERIIEAARRASRDPSRWQQEAREVARRLTVSTYNWLDKSITFSVPSAVQVLETGQGDCNEHTVLYVAMARAMGLPARTAVGLVFVNGAFFYHAWPEVWLDERWVAVDPTFGQVPADAAHIRFVTGSLANQVEIVRLIGRLNIEVLLDEPAADD